MNIGPATELESEAINSDLIKAALINDANKIYALTAQDANIDIFDAKHNASALTIAVRSLFLASVNAILANAPVMASIENDLEKALKISESMLADALLKEWLGGNIEGDSIEEIAATFKNAKSNAQIYTLLQNSDSYAYISSLLLNIRNANEIRKLLQDAKYLHALVEDVITDDLLKANQLLKKQLFKNLYPHMRSIITLTSNDPSRQDFIKNLKEQLLLQGGKIHAGSDCFKDMQLHKFFLLSELVDVDLMKVKDVRNYIAKFVPGFQFTTNSACKKMLDVNVKRMKM